MQPSNLPTDNGAAIWGHRSEMAARPASVWAMSTSEIALTVHLVVPEGHPGDDFINRIADELHDNFAIEHATIQIETGSTTCVLSNHT